MILLMSNTREFSLRLIFTCLFAVIICCHLSGQGDGPRSHLQAPIGVWGVNAKWLHMDQNLLPAGNILVQDADIVVDVFPTTFFHTFKLGNNLAQALLMVNPGSAVGRLAFDTIVPQEDLQANGFSDGFFGLQYGLVGSPALDINQFAQHTPEFSLSAYLRIWYSGTYNSEKLLNMGTNRWTVELGVPMSLPIANNREKPTWLEMFPSVQLFTPNNAPSRGSSASQTKQKPLFVMENHLTHNFTGKLWGGVDLRLQFGGRTVVDGVEDDNRQAIIGGGVALGYQFLPFLGGYANYGRVLWGDGSTRSEMFRLSLTFTYLDKNKYQ